MRIEMHTDLARTTGALDRVISEMKIWAKRAAGMGYGMDEADAQTLKHHAEDMHAMADYVLDKLAS